MVNGQTDNLIFFCQCTGSVITSVFGQTTFVLDQQSSRVGASSWPLLPWGPLFLATQQATSVISDYHRSVWTWWCWKIRSWTRESESRQANHLYATTATQTVTTQGVTGGISQQSPLQGRYGRLSILESELDEGSKPRNPHWARGWCDRRIKIVLQSSHSLEYRLVHGQHEARVHGVKESCWPFSSWKGSWVNITQAWGYLTYWTGLPHTRFKRQSLELT